MNHKGLWAMAVGSFALLCLAVLNPWHQARPYSLGQVTSLDRMSSWQSLEVEQPGELSVVLSRSSSGVWKTQDKRAINQNAVATFLSAFSMLHVVREEVQGAIISKARLSVRIQFKDGIENKFQFEKTSDKSEYDRLYVGQMKKAQFVQAYLVDEMIEAINHLETPPLRQSSPKQYLSKKPKTNVKGMTGDEIGDKALESQSIALIREEALFASDIVVKDTVVKASNSNAIASTVHLKRGMLANQWSDEEGQLSKERATQLAILLRDEISALDAWPRLDTAELFLTENKRGRKIEITYEGAVDQSKTKYTLRLIKNRKECLVQVDNQEFVRLESSSCKQLLQPL